MNTNSEERERVSSGVSRLDSLLGGVFVGDNVVWYDDAGSLASVFFLNFIKASQAIGRPLIYVTFDRSPRNLLEKLGESGKYPGLVILDCFTHGKGAGSEVFLKFYSGANLEHACQVVRVEHPREPGLVTDSLYTIQSAMQGEVHLLFESITGMQELWGSEEKVLHYYMHTCPRLYELNTVAYWVMEKHAHSSRFRAHINQIAQVAIELSIRRGTTSLTILKADRRDTENFHKPHVYWARGREVTIEDESGTSVRTDLGRRLREVRNRRGISQSDLARLVGVTPSTISQVESNLIYPSLPALIKIAEILAVDISSFFRSSTDSSHKLVFGYDDATSIRLSGGSDHGINVKLLTPEHFAVDAELYWIDIPPKTKFHGHFLKHKGPEAGYLFSGMLQMTVDQAVHTIQTGEIVYLTREIPTNWANPGETPGRLLWIKIK